MSTDLGSIKKIHSEVEVEWTILDFFTLPKDIGYFRYSPNFNFLGSHWYMLIRPNGSENSPSWISLYLMREISVSELNVSFTISLKTKDGKVIAKRDFSDVFGEARYDSGTEKFCSVSELMQCPQLVASGNLSIVCCIRRQKSNINEKFSSSDMMKEKQVGERVLVDASLQTENSEPDAPSLEKTVKSLNALSQSFKALLLNGECHDVTLKVKGREFQAHQSILRARSQVLDSTLKYDMVEKNSGIISIDDCDPSAFEQFLLYIYSGKVETLDKNNMLGLYYIADKYHLPDLKEETCEFIKKSLSLGVICDVIQLALNHSDSDLISHATDYFAENVNEILTTVQWQTFITENAIQANELFIKAATYLSKNLNNLKA